MPSTCLERAVDVGTVVVVVVPTELTGGCVVVVVVVGATGSLVVARNAVTPCAGGMLVVVVVVGDVVPAVRDRLPVALCVSVGAVTELVDEVVDAANGAIADPGAIDEAADGASSPVDRSGVVDPLGTALGAVGDEPESNARDEKSATMPKTDAEPIPLCRSLIFISRHNLKVDRPPQAIGPEQLMLSCTRLGQNCTSFRAADRPGLRA